MKQFSEGSCGAADDRRDGERECDLKPAFTKRDTQPAVDMANHAESQSLAGFSTVDLPQKGKRHQHKP